MSYNSTQFWHYLPGDSIRSYRLRVSSMKNALTLPWLQIATHKPTSASGPISYRLEVPRTSPWISDTSHKFRFLSRLLRYWLQIRGYQGPLLTFDLFARAVHKTQRNMYTESLVYCKNYITQEQPYGRDALGEVWGRGTELPCLLQMCHIPLKLSEPVLLVFYEDFITVTTDRSFLPFLIIQPVAPLPS